MRLKLDLEAVKQIRCNQCGGIKAMLYKDKEMASEEALRDFNVAPDAWCIC